ncbi:hypothetical protein ABZ897_00460 [Nonomuraea sp. NPDC046802]|uniref:hypothetical protein n=1 Tax=Nonomuraea sp. NPDC046802 TaxID=3154919 RepID=UPI0033C0561E
MADRFRSRPVEVEAIRWLGEENCPEVFAFVGLNHDDWADETDHSLLHVPGLIDSRPARHGDWLVKDDNGVRVMRDAEFNARYEQTPVLDGTATNYHKSIDDLRRDLMKGNAHWEKVAERYSGISDKAEAAAFAAASMAGSYSYTLAAIIGYARKYGEHVAHDLAFEADEILTNGDFEAMNADVIVASAEGLPLPAYMTVDATQGAHGEKPGTHWRCAEHQHTGTWTRLDDNAQAARAALAARADAITHLDRLHDGWRPTEPATEPAGQAEIPSS